MPDDAIEQRRKVLYTASSLFMAPISVTVTATIAMSNHVLGELIRPLNVAATPPTEAINAYHLVLQENNLTIVLRGPEIN